jgi:hypothetical protein
MITNLAHKLEYYKRLDELSARRYLGLLALDLGWHGVKSVSESFGVHAHTVRKGKQEVQELQQESHINSRIRKIGGGRKKS